MKYPIVHAERDILFHHGLKNLFSDNDEFDFVDHCCYLDSALKSLDHHKPRLLITGTHLYDERFVVESFCEYRRSCLPELKIIVLTSLNELDYLINSFLSGVDGYLTKDATAEEIFHCLLDVYIGDSHITIPPIKKENKS